MFTPKEFADAAARTERANTLLRRDRFGWIEADLRGDYLEYGFFLETWGRDDDPTFASYEPNVYRDEQHALKVDADLPEPVSEAQAVGAALDAIARDIALRIDDLERLRERVEEIRAAPLPAREEPGSPDSQEQPQSSGDPYPTEDSLELIGDYPHRT